MNQSEFVLSKSKIEMPKNIIVYFLRFYCFSEKPILIEKIVEVKC